MEEIAELLIKSPKTGSTLILTSLASLGWISRNLFDILIDKRKYKRELNTYFWKEKINASKKASEYYLEFLNFLNLTQIQFENFELQKIEHQDLIKNIQKEVEFYSNKLKTFPHFEHHHINIFYEFDGEKTLKITTENNQLLRELFELNSKKDNSGEKAKEIFKKLKDNYKELFAIHKEYLKKVRNDLKGYV